jgi:hypothetical protein
MFRRQESAHSSSLPGIETAEASLFYDLLLNAPAKWPSVLSPACGANG